jgi:hypothetical protein
MIGNLLFHGWGLGLLDQGAELLVISRLCQGGDARISMSEYRDRRYATPACEQGALALFACVTGEFTQQKRPANPK